MTKLKCYVCADAQKTIQWIVDETNKATNVTAQNLDNVDIESIKKSLLEVGIRGNINLASQVSGDVHQLILKIVRGECVTYMRFKKVSPNDIAEITSISCDSILYKIHLLQEFEGCAC